MRAKVSIILTLIVSLLFVGQVQPMARPMEMKQGGACAGMQCVRGCCTNKTCCTVTENQQTPESPAPAAPRVDFQLADLGLCVRVLLFAPPATPRPLVIPDDAIVAHALPPLVVNCIRLI